MSDLSIGDYFVLGDHGGVIYEFKFEFNGRYYYQDGSRNLSFFSFNDFVYRIP